MTLYHLCILATCGAAIACAFRARLLATAFLPALLLIAARETGLVDISSASHPLRWLVPIASLSVAMFAAWREARRPVAAKKQIWRRLPNVGLFRHDVKVDEPTRNTRILVASILVFASGCADIPALLVWSLPGEWVLVPLQIAVCLVVIGALIAPERWFYVR